MRVRAREPCQTGKDGNWVQMAVVRKISIPFLTSRCSDTDGRRKRGYDCKVPRLAEVICRFERFGSHSNHTTLMCCRSVSLADFQCQVGSPCHTLHLPRGSSAAPQTQFHIPQPCAQPNLSSPIAIGVSTTGSRRPGPQEPAPQLADQLCLPVPVR